MHGIQREIKHSVARSKSFVTKTINFFLDVQNSRFEVNYHWIVDRRIRERLVDFLLEDLLSLFEYRYVGLQHNASDSPKLSPHIINEILIPDLLLANDVVATIASWRCHNERLSRFALVSY